jgi:hypothetical protein
VLAKKRFSFFNKIVSYSKKYFKALIPETPLRLKPWKINDRVLEGGNVTDRRFQPNLMFVNIPECPIPTNVRLGWFDKRSRLLLKS